MANKVKEIIVPIVVLALFALAIYAIAYFMPSISLVEGGTKLLLYTFIVSLLLGPIFYYFLKSSGHSPFDSFRYAGISWLASFIVLLGLVLWVNFSFTSDCSDQRYNMVKMESFYASSYGRLESEKLANRWKVTFDTPQGQKEVIFAENPADALRGNSISFEQCKTFFGQEIYKLK